MEYARRFKFLVCAPAFDEADLEGARLRQILTEIEGMGYAVLRARRDEDAELVVRTDAAIGCVVVDWGKKGLQGKAAALISLVRRRGTEVPIFLLVRRRRLEDIPVDVLDDVDGFVFLAEETPEFIAKNLVSRLRQYAETLKTPFFGALVDYAEQGNQLWTCPGHNGGMFYSRSPIGRIFVEHLGEAVFRDDLDNSVLQLGDLLTHEGPALKAQREAAKIFGAERTYFVLNGTSTSNKIALNALLAEGDLVLFDRNNHKAAHHGALFLSGALPIFVETARNPHGLIGPMLKGALSEERLREAIRTNPLVSDAEAWRRPRPFRAAVIEQCTYDGTIYSAEEVLNRIGHLCDYILFDEAWAGFMKFHPLFRGRFGMGLEKLGPDAPGILVTQSTHKQLASFSQASQIHVKDSHLGEQRRRVGHRRFNEMYLLHASTSPFYPLFASLDVGAQMMKGRSGEVLWDDTVRLGIEMRKKLRFTAREMAEKEVDPARRWFFEPFVPKTVRLDGVPTPWEEVPTDLLAANPEHWEFRPGEDWHGFGDVPAGWAMTDPNKLTVLTPGFTDGGYARHGVPAPVVAEYLRQNRIVPEKNDLNSLLFLLTPGSESSKAGTLLSHLVTFKKLHDQNAPLEEVIPGFVARRPKRYAGLRLRELCAEMHDFYRAQDVSGLQAAQFQAGHFPEMVMPPHEAVRELVRNRVDYVPLDECFGRVAVTLWLVYPPGIATVIPGERLGEASRPMIDYLKAFERAANRFPGFENEIQGLYRETDPDGQVRFYTYVLRETA
ncbi:Ornithine decarboxylase (plasmid) [Roseomonas mucosa]|uniref:Amino acid decarboxylase n=1 Tax=Roseomonas mucosa TaxID=207340 RepID=A0A1S8D4G5_9PROT|nr:MULTISPECIES: Orn/Lys/Arg decarboxylase N-terminal domain-containing protein [Roseomonas]MBS5904608.1 amino acid decarboxylase [Acetobacteraceae bacterium]MCG7351807.1 beta-eliminating lyase-related protein [Roseomonas mucosa]MCG7357402.1 beta-eliminating lyase-related protein [Roseomonas mucosa]MDT8292078.1 Orn/Lys/Arg decarboxylase N-terminal domain-containing protein [Roseomonas mucosa]MDT8295831.1 Orn/Lys/Arg decarboxylase N-terminal domain-containing protein [Roseomonas mucosa]